MYRSLATAIRTLTVCPMPGKDASRLESALYFFPLVGFGLGWILYRTAILFGTGPQARWPEGTAVLLTALGLAMTRGLHLDGLSDWADGFWGGRDREHTLTIMKDSRIGSFGAAALVVALLAKWACFAELIRLGAQTWIVTAMVVSRTTQVALAATQPYARAEDGTGGPFIRQARIRHFLAALGLASGLLFLWHGSDWRWIPALALGWILARVFGLWCWHKIRGVTGDLLGAVSELSEIALLATGIYAYNL